MHIYIEKNPVTWNEIVDTSPYSVLHHRYELLATYENALPLIVEERDHKFLFPLRVMELVKSFRLAVTSVYSYASVLPDQEKAVDLMPEALDRGGEFLKEKEIDYLSMCAPSFLSKPYVASVDSWFRKNKASLQILYAHMIRIKNATFEEVLKSKFSKHARYNIRRAEREGVTVIEIENEDEIQRWIEDIHQCNLSALKRQGREGAYPDSYKDVYLSELVSDKRRLGEHFKIYGAIYRERLIAYIIIQEYNKLVQTTKLMSHTKYLDKRSNDALFAYVMKEVCKRGGLELFEYGLERTKLGGKIPSLYPALGTFFSKFGFEEVPIFIYRLGLTPSGRILQYLFSSREYLVTRYAYFPSVIQKLSTRLYVPRRRRLFALLNT